MALTTDPVASAQMRMRCPVAKAFQAVVDPEVTTRFWFTRSSAPLEPGASVRWDWQMYGASTQVTVVDFAENRRLLLHWGEPARPLEFTFDERPDGSALVAVRDSGFTGSDDEKVAQALDSSGGFSFMLAGMKAWLEHGIELNLVADHHPDAHQSGR